MGERIKKTIAFLIVVSFLVTVTAGAVSAHNKESDDKSTSALTTSSSVTSGFVDLHITLVWDILSKLWHLKTWL